MLLPGPTPVLGQVGAGGAVARRQAADGQSCGGKCRHAGQAVRHEPLASTGLRSDTHLFGHFAPNHTVGGPMFHVKHRSPGLGGPARRGCETFGT
ncbi:hypothetical protein SBD_5661 [Streptomyces bottropensis ATCC 25435]|uniref:Uncharacterized protein n=1 Tax=Streptomyces bottropensis ATCC 25435 TaxID=1054862 RepID=M3FKI5_9ACTN|nr:hypothetical protein SBD_5661 [Streptomyces bottropensis ATCC 25435]